MNGWLGNFAAAVQLWRPRRISNKLHTSFLQEKCLAEDLYTRLCLERQSQRLLFHTENMKDPCPRRWAGTRWSLRSHPTQTIVLLHGSVSGKDAAFHEPSPLLGKVFVLTISKGSKQGKKETGFSGGCQRIIGIFHFRPCSTDLQWEIPKLGPYLSGCRPGTLGRWCWGFAPALGWWQEL